MLGTREASAAKLFTASRMDIQQRSVAARGRAPKKLAIQQKSSQYLCQLDPFQDSETLQIDVRVTRTGTNTTELETTCKERAQVLLRRGIDHPPPADRQQHTDLANWAISQLTSTCSLLLVGASIQSGRTPWTFALA